jgi:Immunity protein 40
MVWSHAIDRVLSIGISLQDIGIRNWALDREHARDAVSLLAEMGVPILGGDVYVLCDGVPESTYDNWYCDRAPLESESEYLLRSKECALRYIGDYLQSSPDVLFAVVPEVKSLSPPVSK